MHGSVVRAEDATEDEVTGGASPDVADTPDVDDAPEDAADDEGDAPVDDDSTVESEEEASEPAADATATETTEEEEEKPSGIGPSPDAETTVLFPEYPDKQLPAGKPIKVLIGLSNKGEKDLIVDTIDASFRYPQDYSYHIQNFTASYYSSVVAAGGESTFQYSFYPHESYGGRPFGLTVMMLYKDNEGGEFAAGVFNETVTFKELEDTFDGEQFFMYVFLAAIALLVIFGINYAFVGAKGSKRSKNQAKSEQFEQGTQNGDVDYDWLPKDTISDFSKTSPRQSPRQRKNKQRANQSAGSGVESE